MRLRLAVFVWCALFFLPFCIASAAEGESFLKEGDRWLFIGDSITNTDTYRKVILRVLQHYHPQADIMVGNSAVNGVTSDYKEKREFTPTVVTIMLGMNDVIHQDWAFTPDLTQKVEAYRKGITAKVQEYKKLGAEVILMTPTYPDERFPTYFNVAMTRRFLEAYGKVVREIAAAEKCHWVPVGEELEAFQNTLGIDQQVRPDGVHPYGLGQYQIARSLMQRLNLAGTLSGKRVLHSPVPPLDLDVSLNTRFMHTPAEGVSLQLAAPVATKVKASWSLAGESGSVVLELSKEKTVWRVPVSEKALTLAAGKWSQLVLEFSSGQQKRLCIIDLARTKVLKMKDGVLTGSITTTRARPEGKTVATWKIEDKGNELWFSGDVFDNANQPKMDWPFLRDGVQIWLDLRPPARFAGINPDRDVSDTFINVRYKPYFCVTPVCWIRPRLMYGAACGGVLTRSGYRWHWGIGGNVSDVRKLNLDKLDYFGMNMVVCDNDPAPKPGMAFYKAMDFDAADQMHRLNLLMIVDRKGTFPGTETTNLHLFQ